MPSVFCAVLGVLGVRGGEMGIVSGKRLVIVIIIMYVYFPR